MKKFIMLSALVAATSTAFVACSSDDDLAQQPKAPETIVENGSSEGTPFSVNPSSDATRAVRYGSSAWGNYDSEHPANPYVDCFKLYGKQSGLTAWIDNVVFTRAKSDGAVWGPDRIQSTSVGSLSWPKDDTGTPSVKESEVATNFYAVTDNAIIDGDDTDDPDGIVGLSEWMNTEGSFTYTLQTTQASIPWEDPGNPGALTPTNVTFVDPAKMRDLMYATTTKTEAGVTDGQLPLQFHHALSGLSIKAKFLSDGEYDPAPADNGWAKIKAVFVCGLNTIGTFTMTPSSGTGAWSGLGTSKIYYYAIPDAGGRKIDVQEETNYNKANPAITELVPAGQWLALPQTVTACGIDYSSGALPTTGAYVILMLEDFQDEGTDFFLFYPISTTLNAGKNRVITIDIAQGRDPAYNTDDPAYCDLFYSPSQAGGSGSREFSMDEEK